MFLICFHIFVLFIITMFFYAFIVNLSDLESIYLTTSIFIMIGKNYHEADFVTEIRCSKDALSFSRFSLTHSLIFICCFIVIL